MKSFLRGASNIIMNWTFPGNDAAQEEFHGQVDEDDASHRDAESVTNDRDIGKL